MRATGSKETARTCSECRSRKVRCDGQRTGCASCQRLGFECSFRENNGNYDSGVQLRRPRRCRVRQACTACHKLKIRCSGSVPKCNRCGEKNLSCIYSSSGSRRQTLPAAASHVGTPQNLTSNGQSRGNSNTHLLSRRENPSSLPLTAEDQEESHHLLTRQRVKSALQSFFDNIYTLPTFSFLHKVSLLQWNQTGQADRCLLLSIIAISSRLPNCDPAEVRIGARCAEVAQDILLKGQGRPNVIKTQSLLLIIRYHMWSGNTTEALMLMATLARFAFALRLNDENPNLCSLAQESRRRLMWAVYVLDTFLAGGLPEFTLCPSDVLHVSLPNKETTFELDTSYVHLPLNFLDDPSNSEEVGLLGYYIRIIYLRDCVLRRTKQVASSSQQAQLITAMTNDLKSQLDHLALSLPETMVLTEKNLHLRAYSKWLPRYIIMHLWFQQCYCDLYRCFFANLRESYPQDSLYQLDPQFVLDCQEDCLQHARQIGTICSFVHGLDLDNLVLDIETAECVYQAGRILLHGYQAPLEARTPPRPFIISLVNDCILFIENLALMFPTVATIAKDLNAILHQSRSISIPSNHDSIPLSNDLIGESNGPAFRNRRQIISKHSSLNRSQLNDEFVSADMPFVESRHREPHGNIVGTESGAFVSSDSPARGRNSEQLDNTVASGLRLIPPLSISQEILNPRVDDILDPTSAFEGAWDMAILHPLYDQQDIWPTLSFFPTH